MALKRLFGGGKSSAGEAPKGEKAYSIDELIILEQYDQAVEKLNQKLKLRKDLHLHLKLAEVYLAQKLVEKAIDQFVFVAEEYARDGFFEKGIAILSKAVKINPMDEALPLRLDKMKKFKELESARTLALEGLREGQKGRDSDDRTTVVEFNSIWSNLSSGEIVKRLRAEQLQLLFSAVGVEHLYKAQVLVEQGAQQEQLYIIARGVLEALWQNPAGEQIMVRNFGVGQTVGERALFERRAWPATYRASEPVTVLALDRTGLEKTLAGNPDPRRYLEVLRSSKGDVEVEGIIRKMTSRGV